MKNCTSHAQMMTDFKKIVLYTSLLTSLIFFCSTWLTKTRSIIWAIKFLIFFEWSFKCSWKQFSKFCSGILALCMYFLVRLWIIFWRFSLVFFAIHVHNSVIFSSSFSSNIDSKLLLRMLSSHISGLIVVIF